MSFEEKVIGLLEKIDAKLDKLLGGGGSTEEPLSEPPALAEDSYVKPSALLAKQEEAEQAEVRPPVEGRRVCPDCGGTQFNTIEDKTQILHQQGGVKIYAKKYICKKCGGEAF